MKPFPKELQEMFPHAPGQVANRPWWRQAVRTAVARRSDESILARDPDALRDYDEAHPLPHPGIRVGQTWAWLSEREEGRIMGVATILEYDPDRESGPYRCAHWLFGGEWIVDEELHRLLQHGYLLVDVVCPHLAPWSAP